MAAGCLVCSILMCWLRSLKMNAQNLFNSHTEFLGRKRWNLVHCLSSCHLYIYIIMSNKPFLGRHKNIIFNNAIFLLACQLCLVRMATERCIPTHAWYSQSSHLVLPKPIHSWLLHWDIIVSYHYVLVTPMQLHAWSSLFLLLWIPTFTSPWLRTQILASDTTPFLSWLVPGNFLSYMLHLWAAVYLVCCSADSISYLRWW